MLDNLANDSDADVSEAAKGAKNSTVGDTVAEPAQDTVAAGKSD